jgi:hypothetical protein
MGWKPLHERDTRYYLWEVKFKCRLPLADTISLDELRAFGVPTTGDKTMDRNTMAERVERLLSIDQMFEYWRAGVNVSVVKREDTGKIYEYISNHLTAMKKEAEKSFNTSHIPFEDLIALDQFANSVYEYAQYQFTHADMEALLAKKMKSIVRFSPTDILGGGRKPLQQAVNQSGDEDEDEPQRAKRPSLSEYFTNMSRRNR